jgi:hypothetical protein
MSGTAQSPISRKHSLVRDAGGRGRIRTSVARKERQIYSLLVLATHPPVPRDLPGHSYCHRIPTGKYRNAERARARRHQPQLFYREEFVRIPQKYPGLRIQLAEGIEPPTL